MRPRTVKASAVNAEMIATNVIDRIFILMRIVVIGLLSL